MTTSIVFPRGALSELLKNARDVDLPPVVYASLQNRPDNQAQIEKLIELGAFVPERAQWVEVMCASVEGAKAMKR